MRRPCYLRPVGLIDGFLNDFGPYPLRIFGGTLEFLLTFVLPMAFVAYFPATVLLGRTGELRVSAVFAYFGPLAGLLWLRFALWFWQHELQRYQSAGH
jgi:ABC-2 type transport system permease protein